MTFFFLVIIPLQNSGPCNSFYCLGHFKNVYDDDGDWLTYAVTVFTFEGNRLTCSTSQLDVFCRQINSRKCHYPRYFAPICPSVVTVDVRPIKLEQHFEV